MGRPGSHQPGTRHRPPPSEAGLRIGRRGAIRGSVDNEALTRASPARAAPTTARGGGSPHARRVPPGGCGPGARHHDSKRAHPSRPRHAATARPDGCRPDGGGDVQLIDDRTALPVRDFTALREDVGHRVQRARRRRRMRRVGAPAAVVAMLAPLLLMRVSGGEQGATDIRMPASEATQEERAEAPAPSSDGSDAGAKKATADRPAAGGGGGTATGGPVTGTATGEPLTGGKLPALPWRTPSEPVPDDAAPAAGPLDFRLAVTTGGRDVWELADDATPLRMLASDAYSPAWSPDGRFLAYLRS